MTLLTPAVMHRSSLEKLVQQPTSFFKSYIFQFALLQGLFGALIGLAMVARVVNLFGDIYQPKIQSAIVAANFSRVEISNGKLLIDIKPAIWTYSLAESSISQSVLAVDSLGSMNKYFWDDRYEKGVLKKVYGVAFRKDSLFVRTGYGTFTVAYSKIVGNRSHVYTKEEVNKLFQRLISAPSMAVVYSVFAVISFVGAFLFGYAFHLLFAFVVGGAIALLTNYQTLPLLKSMKLAAGMYIVWVYLSLLINMAGILLPWHNVSIYVVIVQAVSLCALIGIGVMFARSSKFEIVGNSGTKVKAKVNAEI